MEVLEVIKKAEEAVAARRLIESGWNETASELAAHRASRAISARTYRLGLLALRESGAPVRLLAAATGCTPTNVSQILKTARKDLVRVS